MEKRVTLAIVLSFAFLLIWTRFIAEPPEKPPQEDVPVSEGGASPGVKPGDAGVGDTPSPPTTSPQETSDKPGSGTPERIGTPPTESRVHILGNKSVSLEIDPRGAVVSRATLLGFTGTPGTEDKLDFIRSYEGSPRALAINNPAYPGWLSKQVWTLDSRPSDNRTATFSIALRDDLGAFTLKKTFRLGDSGSRVAVDVSLTPSEGAKSTTRTFVLVNSGGVFPPDRVDKAPPHSLLGLGSPGSVEVSSFTAQELLEESDQQKNVGNNAIAFTCDMGVYFGAYLRLLTPKVGKGAVFFAFKKTGKEDHETRGSLRSGSGINFFMDSGGAQATAASFDYYMGPKDFGSIRENYGGEQEGDLREDYVAVAEHELSAQGFCCSSGPFMVIVNAIARFVLWALHGFYSLFGNMGVAIIALTFCVKIVLFPINRRSQLAMQRHQAGLQRIKPKLDKLKEKYKNDKQKFAQEQMKLMKQEKVQMLPIGGCLPMFLQMPIFFGLIAAIRFGIDLRHAPFLWCEDLSMADQLVTLSDPMIFAPFCCPQPIAIEGLNLFPIAMTLAWFFNQKMMPKSPDPQMAQQQKMMLFMPLVFGVMMYGFAAGLSLYWLTSSLIGIFEQRVIKKMFPIEGSEAPA